jgi:hypothetical protein
MHLGARRCPRQVEQNIELSRTTLHKWMKSHNPYPVTAAYQNSTAVPPRHSYPIRCAPNTNIVILMIVVDWRKARPTDTVAYGHLYLQLWLTLMFVVNPLNADKDSLS